LELKCPFKYQMYMWLVLKDNVLTWDHLQKRCRFGPHMCHFCKENEENIYHLLVLCPYSMQGWKEVDNLSNLKEV